MGAEYTEYLKTILNPDWDKLEAAHESLREHMQIISELKAENAALKAKIAGGVRGEAEWIDGWHFTTMYEGAYTNATLLLDEGDNG